jgi:ribosomal-protein-alanine N-acetyltransferase
MSESEASCLQIRPLEPAQIPLVTAWARQEGFMPGSGDVAIYRQTDRQGIWVAWLNDRPIGCIAGVRYNAAYGFIGLFIVRPDQRGHGYGIQLWRHALDHLSDVRCIGLEAAPDRIADYASWGFQAASPTRRWQIHAPADLSPADQAPADLSPGGSVDFKAAGEPDSQADQPATNTSPGHDFGQDPGPYEALPLALVTAEALPEAALQAYDASHEATPRPHFLRDWLRHPAGTVWALIDPQQRCHGFGRIRPCQLPQGQGWRIGPLIADSPQLAERLLVQLLQHHPGAVLIDAPGANPAAANLLRSRGFSVVGETLRMYRGPIPQLPLQDVFGLACLELG